jgi:hypothetical protein
MKQEQESKLMKIWLNKQLAVTEEMLPGGNGFCQPPIQSSQTLR